jgi:hypothetical protein
MIYLVAHTHVSAERERKLRQLGPREVRAIATSAPWPDYYRGVMIIPGDTVVFTEDAWQGEHYNTAIIYLTIMGWTPPWGTTDGYGD